MLDYARAGCDILWGCPGGPPSGVVTFLFTDLRVRPAGGRPTRMRCGWRWPPMTRCCATRLRRTGVGCSSTPATACVPPSPHPDPAVDAAVAAQRALELPVRMGIATGEAELRGADYFGAVLESCGAGDGRRAWRSDPAGRLDGGSTQRR